MINERVKENNAKFWSDARFRTNRRSGLAAPGAWCPAEFGQETRCKYPPVRRGMQAIISL